MKLLIITNLFPNKKEPTKAVYNRQQLGELSKLCELKIIAPLPLFQYSLKEVPGCEVIEGIDVYHPRYLVTPKILRSLYGLFFFLGVKKTVKELFKTFRFDIILCTWAYPDGFASALLSGIFKKKLFIKVHGTDINLHTKYFLRRKMIAYALGKAAGIIAVSNDLKKKMVALGISPEKIEVVPNGVNIDLFRPLNKNECRKTLKLSPENKIVLYVGNIEKVKGVDVLIDTMQSLNKDVYLLLVGSGRLKNSLQSKVRRLKLGNRVAFLGTKPHSEVPLWMNAANLFCLPSRNEGCPNVILEALACGTPVVASRIGGIPELIKNKELGALTSPGNISELSQGIKEALEKKWNCEKIRQNVLGRDWEQNVNKLFHLLRK